MFCFGMRLTWNASWAISSNIITTSASIHRSKAKHLPKVRDAEPILSSISQIIAGKRAVVDCFSSRLPRDLRFRQGQVANPTIGATAASAIAGILAKALAVGLVFELGIAAGTVIHAGFEEYDWLGNQAALEAEMCGK